LQTFSIAESILDVVGAKKYGFFFNLAKLTGTPIDALAPCLWSGSVNWCLAEGYGNEAVPPMGFMAWEALYVIKL